ncbi:hypothetical protein Vretimale_7336 [Volvox reticuliferus]|uniref:Uncharacterized protein n=1 Tax=Volvox reticuliferus TaxID=1737510 RepID=A0A8J4G9C7_9CHLO|nr:hypothetical protein Vretimale_7336 [Volvox reticuliferus]
MPSRGAIHASTPFHSQAIVAAGPALPRVASVTSLKRGVAPMRLSYDVGGRMGGKVRHKSNSCCGLMASNPEHMDLSSICDTQEAMDSAMVQEILGSVDANHVRETQVLLSSFNWDLDELLHEEAIRASPCPSGVDAY